MFCILFLVIGCASSPVTDMGQRIELSPKLLISISDFREIFPRNAVIKQFISYSRKNKNESAQVVIKNLKDLRITILSPFGVELLSLKLENQTLQKVSGVPGIDVKFFDRAMADMLAIYSSHESLKENLKAERQVNVDTTVKTRAISLGETRIIDIAYDGGNPWESEIIFKHHSLNYELNIKSIAIDYETLY